MKSFEMTHKFFDMKSFIFTEKNPPEFLLSKVYRWWWDNYVMKLNVGESVDSDFQSIKRIK